MLDLFNNYLALTGRIVNSIEFKYDSVKKPTFFSKKNKVMDFSSMIYCILSNTNKPLQIHLDQFFETFKTAKGVEKSLSKQAFSEARLKLKYQAFITLNKTITNDYYANINYNKFLGCRLLAVDGSDFDIPNTVSIQNHFGYAKNQYDKVCAQAHAAVIYDVLNDLIVESTIDTHRINEKLQAKTLIESFHSDAQSDLYIMDRGYYAGYMLHYLDKRKYIMRLPSACSKELKEANDEDQILTVKTGQESLRVRVINIVLPTGEIEKLVTNIFDKSITPNDFKAIYRMRWGVETKYNQLKNRLKMESFSGKHPEIIYQDFYSAIFLSNLIAFAKMDADAMIQEDDKKYYRKYKNKTNMNYLIPKMIRTLVECLLEEDNFKRTKKLAEISQKIRKHYIPIRPERYFKQGTKQNYNHCNLSYKTGL